MPPPYSGLDLVSPIDEMDPSFALELVNVVPTAGAPEVRKGYVENSDTATAAPLKTLRGFPLQNGTTKLIGVASGKIWDCSTDPATDITGATVITSDDMSTEVFNNRLFLCNGVDNVQVYDGTTVADSTFTGATLSDLINVSSYKERLYFVEKDSLKMWYGGVRSISGALTDYNFESIFREGGYLLFAGSYTNQTAAASQDLFFACSSEGELLFYSGTYAGDPTTWGIVARYYIGRPLGYNAFIRINQDVWILTQQGIVPISALFAGDPAQAINTVSQRINPLISQAASQLPFSYRWHGMFYPLGRKVFVMLPSSDEAANLLVYSLDSKGWTKYQLANSGHCISMAIADGAPYYGSAAGKVYEAETGYQDAGEPITFSGRTAFSFYGSRGNYKVFRDIRPLLKSIGGQSLALGLDTDFKRRPIVESVTIPSTSYTPWGSPWGSPWSGGEEYLYNRFATKGQGHSAAIRFGGSVDDYACQILGFEIRFELGGQV